MAPKWEQTEAWKLKVTMNVMGTMSRSNGGRGHTL